MKENCRNFIKKSPFLAVALSVGGVNAALSDTFIRNVKYSPNVVPAKKLN